MISGKKIKVSVSVSIGVAAAAVAAFTGSVRRRCLGAHYCFLRSPWISLSFLLLIEQAIFRGNQGYEFKEGYCENYQRGSHFQGDFDRAISEGKCSNNSREEQPNYREQKFHIWIQQLHWGISDFQWTKKEIQKSSYVFLTPLKLVKYRTGSKWFLDRNLRSSDLIFYHHHLLPLLEIELTKA